MTGYQSKRAAAQDKLKCQCSLSTKLVGSGCQYCNPEYMDDDDAQPAQELTLQEQLDKAEADWNKALQDWQKAKADCGKANADWEKAVADLDKANADCGKAKAERVWIETLMEQTK